jgi:hypothetical protein
MFGVSGALAGSTMFSYIKTQECWSDFIQMNSPLGEAARKKMGITAPSDLVQEWKNSKGQESISDDEEFPVEKPISDDEE